MAELTKLDEKLAEVLGLAQAAQEVTDKVRSLLEAEDEAEIAQKVGRMHDEAAETEERCTDVAGERDGRKTAILDKAAETKKEAKEMMSTYLGEDAEALDGLEFMTMAEAGEVGHWEVLRALNSNAGDSRIEELVTWALPIQEGHLESVRRCSTTLAASEDPNETS